MLAASSQAHAQRLNLGGSPLPKPGEGKAVLGLGAELRESSPRGDAPADRASRALHFLASDLLNKGEASGPAGSARILLGLKIAHRLPAFDALVGSVDPAIAAIVASDLEALAKGAPADVPGVQIALRDALAPLTRVVPPPWPRSSLVPVSAAAPALPQPPFSDAATLAASSELRARLADAMAIPAYARAAGELDQELTLAERVIAESPAWLSAPARDRLASDVALCVRMLAVDITSEPARQGVGRVLTISGLLRGTDILKGAVANRMRTAITRLIVALPAVDRPGAASAAQTLASLADASALLSRRSGMGDEKQFVRQLRPAFRTLHQLAEITESDLAEVLPDVLERADAMSTPKVIGAIAAHRRSLDDLILLRAASDSLVLAGSSGAGDLAARDETKPVADRLLLYAKEAADTARKDDGVSRQKLAAALVRFRALAAEVHTALDMPGESELRAGNLKAVLGDAQASMVAALDSTRAEWLKSWAGADRAPAPGVSKRLLGMHTVLEFAGQASVVAGMIDDQPKNPGNSWGAFELDSTVLRTLGQGMPEAIKNAAELVVKDQSGADKELSSIEDRYAVVLLAAQIGVALKNRGVAPCPNAGAAVAELAAGPPPASTWMFASLPDAAAICRYAYEASRADVARRQTILDSIRQQAKDLARAARE